MIAMVASHQDMPKAINELPDRYADIFTLIKSPRRREPTIRIFENNSKPSRCCQTNKNYEMSKTSIFAVPFL